MPLLRLRGEAFLAAAIAIALMPVATAAAAPPPNDALADAWEFGTRADLSAGTGDISAATSEATHPVVVCSAGAPSPAMQSVWFGWTPAAGVQYVNVSSVGSKGPRPPSIR